MAALESLIVSRFHLSSSSPNPPFQSPTKLCLPIPTSSPNFFFKPPLFTLSLPISTTFQGCLSSTIQHEITEEEEEKLDNKKKLVFVLNLPRPFSVADVTNLLGECETMATNVEKPTPPNETHHKLFSCLKQFFADFDPRVVFSPSAGYGFVSFASKEEAEFAISALNHNKGLVENQETVSDQELIKVKLFEYIANKYVILFFDFTPASDSIAHQQDLDKKLIYLDSFGIDLIPLLTTHPLLISTSLSDIKSTISFLSSTTPLSPPALHRLVSLCPALLTLPLPSIISTITFLLREANVRPHHLRRVIHRRPRLLASDVKTRLRPTLYFLQGTIGISEINKHTHLLSSSVEDKLLPRIQYFNENIVISYNDTILIFRRFPSLFCYSIKDNLEPKFNYFVVEMGRDLKELVEFPQYFSFSLENRIKPRHRRCVEKNVCLPLPAMLRLTEKRFLERLEVCCGSSTPVRNSPFWYYTHHSDY
ncbi:hypothetical protein L6452_24370 [Arctium lappa]|uniref:Uncharacterized protein n=1 Tax=Arctium lappa TaxID=4217 RepID=A0ACB9A9S1_ARCLA|nr:hypothetical protein L6452_24370 [Arctium lappa]